MAGEGVHVGYEKWAFGLAHVELGRGGREWFAEELSVGKRSIEADVRLKKEQSAVSPVLRGKCRVHLSEAKWQAERGKGAASGETESGSLSQKRSQAEPLPLSLIAGLDHGSRIGRKFERAPMRP